jgi:acyl-coenzyme A thioesterase PaaI-like protein
LQNGEATISMPASGWFCGPKGRLHSGIFASLLDMTRLYAVMSTLPADADCTTAELSVTVLGEPPASGGEITGRSRVIYSDERNAAAVQTIAPAGTGFTALDLKVDFLRPARAEGDELVATGVVTHRGRKLSIAHAVVTYRGRRIAVVTGTTALTPPE